MIDCGSATYNTGTLASSASASITTNPPIGASNALTVVGNPAAGGSRQFGFAGDGSFPIFSTWQRPSGTVLDQQGNLWIADRNNHRLRVIQASS